MNYDISYINNILEKYFTSGWTIRSGESGKNNTTRFIEADDKRYVLRIYETHSDIEKVVYEHTILLALEKMTLPFLTPVPVIARNKERFVHTDDGKIAALFHFINGVNPTFEKPLQLDSFGQAVANLTNALKLIETTKSPAYRPYYEIENTHPSCSLSDVILFCSNPDLEFKQQSITLNQIAKKLNDFRESIPKLKQLPHQLVHGDINFSNILTDEAGIVSTFLDFEFVTEDLRVMELCVCLSDMISPLQAEELFWRNIENFLDGYGKIIKLSSDEIKTIPLLIYLRRLDVFIHFLGRYWDGVSKKEIVYDQIKSFDSQIKWLNANEDRLMAICYKSL